jgi:predicted ATP-binding protein involved in virulence
MKLREFSVREFQSVWESGPISVGEVTCLVGKNEAGKTALLKALYRLNPIADVDVNFDVTDDYPRKEVTDYKHEVESGSRAPATVIEAQFELDDDDAKAVTDVFGEAALTSRHFTYSKNYDNKRTYRWKL